ncbi:hypothetical protein ACFL1T_00735 [Chlamydiota bacterium]
MIKKKSVWFLFFAMGLIALSILFYFLHYILFKDSHHIFIYLVGDIAFVPIEVLLVTLIIHKLLSVREKKAILNKLNMVIGAFFSEIGSELLRLFSDCDPDLTQLRKTLKVSTEWSDKVFSTVQSKMKNYSFNVSISKVDLEKLKHYLQKRRNFLLRLLENPNLLEHELFTELLWAIFHLLEELLMRKDLKQLSHNDSIHIENDIKRVYALLLVEWLSYMNHLRKYYSYLFSLAIRMNPFDENPTAEIR